jgi:hypothetical protein
MSEQATLQSIVRSGHRKNFPLISRAAARAPASKPFLACFRSIAGLWYNHISTTRSHVCRDLEQCREEARYRERPSWC